MGYERRLGPYDIVDYTPDNDQDILYIRSNSEINLDDLIDQIEDHFGTRDLSKFSISSEYIHTRCIYYDIFDSGDYDNYIIITRIKEKE